MSVYCYTQLNICMYTIYRAQYMSVYYVCSVLNVGCSWVTVCLLDVFCVVNIT